MLKKSILILNLFLLTTLPITGTTNNSAEFKQWMKQETTHFQDYKDKRDKEFTGFLKNQWKEMQTFQGLVRDKTPKPDKIPKAPKRLPEPVKPFKLKPPPPTISKLPEKLPLDQVSPLPVIIKTPELKPLPLPQKVIPSPIVKQPKGHKIQITFYGHNLEFYYDPQLKVSLQRPINQNSISSIWSDMSKADHDGLLKQINAQRKPLTLNDWGFALLTNTIAQNIHPGSKNDQSVFAWYLMTKAGYQARIAYDPNYVYLLMPSQQQLFAAPYFTFDKVRYYALSFDGVKQKPGKIFTYNGHYPGAT